MKYVTPKWANGIIFIWRGEHPTMRGVYLIERAIRSRCPINNHGPVKAYSEDIIEYRRPKDK